jgi:hypothetical protein
MEAAENTALEIRISELAGLEERGRVKHALFESYERDRLRREAMGRADSDAVRQERQRCVSICERFPDNLMAKHLAKLIRGEE